MIVAVSPTGYTRCRVCTDLVPKGTLRISRKRMYGSTEYFHLHCYRPEKVAPVKADIFCLDRLQEQKHKDSVLAWVENWNKQFVASEDKVPQQFLEKAVDTRATAARRLLIETFAFLTEKEVETAAAQVCKEWFHVTRDQELWKTRFMLRFRPADTEADGDYRRKYIAYHMGACVGCGQIVGQEQIARKCEYYQKVICRQCDSRSEFRVISLNRFTELAHVTSATLKHLEIPTFKHQHAKCSYAALFAEKLIPYAEKRMQLLIDQLKTRFSGDINPEVIREVEGLNVRQFYQPENPGYNTRLSITAKLAFIFCGKCDRAERVGKDVRDFLRQVKQQVDNCN